MFIRSLRLRNFLSFDDRTITFGSITLICGPNGSGKSSIQDGIRFVFDGLTAAIRGVLFKKDLSELRYEHAAPKQQSILEVDVQPQADGMPVTMRRELLTAALDDDSERVRGNVVTPTLEYSLQAHRFAALSPDDRRSLLFGILGVKLDREAAAKELREAKVPEPIIMEVLPSLRSGFPAAQKIAEERVRHYQSAWTGITGEKKYGHVKADGWEPPQAEAVTPAALDEAQEIQRQKMQRHSALSEELGGARQALRSAAATPDSSEVETWRATASKLESRKANKADGEAKLADAKAEVTRLEAAIAATQGLRFDCPHCAGAIRYSSGVAHKDDLAQAPASPVELNAARQRVQEIEAKLVDVGARVTESEAAQRKVAAHDGDVGSVAQSAPAVQYRDVTAIQADLSVATLELEQATATAASLLAQQQSALGRDKKIADATEAHRNAQAWQVAADALAPSGIPATLLVRALAPVNAALAVHATVTGWPMVQIEPGTMAIVREGRAYTRCSESEQWRAQAMIAATLANLSGDRILMLDRLDVLDLPSRGQALEWFQELRKSYLDQIIASATLKQPPEVDDVVTVWLGKQEAADA